MGALRDALRGALRGALAPLKHPLLDAVHPLPARLRLDPGDGVRRAIVQSVLKATELPVELLDAEAGGGVCLWIDDEPSPVRGWAAVCRYLGRLWRLYPVHPSNAARQDAELELLQQLVAHADAGDAGDAVVRAVRRLDERLGESARAHSGPWLEGMARPAIADVCWSGALAWFVARDPDSVFWEGNPHVALWWLTTHGVVVPTTDSDADAADDSADSTDDSDDSDASDAASDDTAADAATTDPTDPAADTAPHPASTSPAAFFGWK